MYSLKFLACSAVSALTVILSANAATRSVDLPWINYANTYIYDITKVVIDDTCTELSMHAYLLPGRSMTLGKEITLRADGKEYALIGSEGIVPDSAIILDANGEAQFKLKFEPLPASTQIFDIIENDLDPYALRMWSVDLNNTEYKCLFPEAFQKEIKAYSEIPDPVFEIGRSTVNFHFIPYRADLPEITFAVQDIGGEQHNYNIKLDNNGEGTITFDQYGTVEALVLHDNGGTAARMTIQPGETIDCYIDPRMSGFQAMAHRDGMSRELYTTVSHNGVYSDFDRETDNRDLKYRLNAHADGFADSNMSVEDYKNKIKLRYELMSDSIMHSEGSRIFKEYQMLLLQNEVMNAMSSHFIHPAIFKGEASMADEDYAEAVEWFDMSNPKLMLLWGSHLSFFDWGKYGARGDLSKSLALFREMRQRSEFGELTPARRDMLKTLSNPFFAEAVDSINERNRREYARIMAEDNAISMLHIGEGEGIKEIIAPHKGKVVVVNLWKPSFDPDRNVNRFESMKSQLHNDDIVWVNLSYSSSQMHQSNIYDKYVELKKKLKGLNYELNNDQIEALCENNGISRFSGCIFVVDREGNITTYKNLHKLKALADLIQSKV